tara:strand:- start:3689 stop:4345 length:657 start_codon:yes stop_codon:yes gene_type:complete
MTKRLLAALVLFILLTTITFEPKIVTSKFNVKKVVIENNSLLKEKDIKTLLTPIYEKNLLFLKKIEIQKALEKNNFIESFKVKKKYPSTLKIKIFEYEPVAILIDKKKKFYVNKKINVIKFKNLKDYKNLPYVFGNKEEFKIFYNNLKIINFPFNEIKKYTFYGSNRWNLETKNDKIIKLHSKNYIKNLENFLSIYNKSDFEKFRVFDYRINNQLILK